VLTRWRRRSTDTAALSSVISRISTAYTDDPNWSSFSAARSSFREEYYSTQTFFADGPEFTSSAISVAATADNPSAAISSIISQSLVAVDEYVSLYIDFVSTQTYLEEDARSGLHSDLQVFTSLFDDATGTDGNNAPSTTATRSGSGSASASSSRTATPRTQTSVSTEVVVRTRPFATTPAATSIPTGATAAATAATGGVAGAPAVNGVVAGAFAGFVAVVGLF